ncbi:MAG: energy-coupling factor ABC transporter ATP-binding protein [Propionibacteriaceae bacterium]|jgi:energy-coupling factor transport system ATP-binding protein|nr:energy-coupling factor ABC transporter ATP-binding protein [Propionibacteriaceae bacterium]
MSLVEASGWGWRYAGRRAWAIRDLDLTIDAGERVLLLGASGAGKSTLLLALAGVLGGSDEGTEAGRLLVDGQHPTRLAGRVGMVQQDPDSQAVLARIGDDVAFGCENLAIPRPAIWREVRRSLDAVGLGLPLTHPTHALSGGQKQRLAIAGLLAMQGAAAERRPGVLLLDEPTANLDPTGVGEVRLAIEHVLADRRTTLIVVEHHVDVWQDLIDRVIVLGPAGLVADGDPAAVFSAHGRELADAGVWVPGVPLPVVPRHQRTRPENVNPAHEVADPGVTQPLQNPVTPIPLTGVVGVRPPTGGDSVAQPLQNPATALEMAGIAGVRPPAPILHTEDLAVGYAAGAVVQSDINVALPRGVSTVITGPNGVGKSTLALTLAGLLPQLTGHVVASEPLRPPPANRRQRRVPDLADPHDWTSAQLLTRLGTVFQEAEHQFVAATVRDELATGLATLRWAGARIAARVDELLATLHLADLAEANPFTLSGGEKRRLSVGSILAGGPEIIVLDEPTFGQDRTTWIDLVRLIMSLLDVGRTVVSVTHDRAFLAVLGEHRIELS